MFTGIVTDIGEVLAVEKPAKDLRRLTIGCNFDLASMAIGASIACSGVCMTIVAKQERNGRGAFTVDAAAETLRVTTVARWKQGTRVNLERPLRLADELGGHLVPGHVDGVAEVIAREDLPDMAQLSLKAPASLARFIAPKGSVALDGVSLTVNDVDRETFSVLIIPHTLQLTTFGRIGRGDAVNLEVDLMARYVARLAEQR